MQFFTVLSLLAATAVAGPLHKVRQAGDSSGTCGGVPYSSGTWTCLENKVLCPIQNGKQFQHCNSQCYDPSIWSCNGGQLAPMGTATPIAALLRLALPRRSPLAHIRRRRPALVSAATKLSNKAAGWMSSNMPFSLALRGNGLQESQGKE
ncbi:hypothetical protein IWX48DRAFT_367995 [Phyllosticta citricarpa]